MSKRKNRKMKKISKVFIVYFLLLAHYSKPSFSINDTFLTQTLSSDTFASVIKILSHFFPSLHGILEELLPKQSKENQLPLNLMGIGNKSLTSFSLSSYGGRRYKNSQISYSWHAHPSVLAASSLEKPRFMPSFPDLNFKEENERGAQHVRFPRVSRALYSLEAKKVSSAWKQEYAGRVFQTVKIDIVPHKPRGLRFPVTSYSEVNTFIKSVISSEYFDEEKLFEETQEMDKFVERKRDNIEKHLNTKAAPRIPHPAEEVVERREKVENILVEPVVGGDHEAEALIPHPAEEVVERREEVEERLVEPIVGRDHEAEALILPAEEIVELREEVENIPVEPVVGRVHEAEALIPDLFQEREEVEDRPVEPDVEIDYEAKTLILHPAEKMIEQKKEKAVELNFSETRTELPLSDLMVPDQEKVVNQLREVLPLKNDKLLRNHVEAIEKALQENKIKFSKESSITIALQRIIKDLKLEITQIPELIEKLSQRIDNLITKTYKISPQEMEKLIWELIQPSHDIITDDVLGVVDFSSGFERLARDVFEVWRSKLLMNYIEKEGLGVLEKSLPSFSDLNPFITNVIDDLFNHEVHAELNSQIKQTARIIINSYVKDASLWGGKGQFSTEEKKKILTQVFKLIVLVPSFQFPLLTNARGNEDIDSDELKTRLKPYVLLAVGQLYGSERARDLSSKSEPVNVPSQENSFEKENISIKEIVKKLDSWLIIRLFDLLSGESYKEKIDFLIKIASQDKELEEIRTKMENCSEADKISLKSQEEKISKKTYSNIIETIMEELGSQDLKGTPLKLAPAFYRDVKCLIEDYLDVGFGFIAAIERTEPSLKKSLQKAKKTFEIHQLVKEVMEGRKYKIQIRRIDGKGRVETSPLKVPEFVFFFSLPYWVGLKERLIKREKLEQEIKEKKQLKKKLLLEEFNLLFFDGELKDLNKSLEELLKKEIKPPAIRQPQPPVSISAQSSSGPPPPPPPPPLVQKESSNLNVIGIQKDIQKSLKDSGLVVKETSLIVEFLLRFRLKNKHIEIPEIVKKFHKKFIAVFYDVLKVADEKQLHESFATQLGIIVSGDLVQRLMKEITEKLQKYFLESLTVENINSILTFGIQTQDASRKFQAKFAEIITEFLEENFQETLKNFKVESPVARRNFQTLVVFLKEKLSESHFKFTNEEKFELVFETFVRVLNEIEQNPDFKLKISDQGNSQFILDIESTKVTLLEFLNEVISKKFGNTHPLVNVPEYEEDVEIKPSKILPYLGDLFLNTAFDILKGGSEEDKVTNLINMTPKQLDLLIEDTLTSLKLQKHKYETTKNKEKTIIFTEHTLKIFKEVIVERYLAFSPSLANNSQDILKKSTHCATLFSHLLVNQLGIFRNEPRKHKIVMSSPHDRQKKIETEETISAFDILLTLPNLWQRKKEIETKKEQAAEERRQKEEETKRRVIALKRFIESEIEISP